MSMSTKKEHRAKRTGLTLTSSQVLGCLQSIAYLASKSLPPMAAMWVNGAYKTLKPIGDFLEEKRHNLLDKYAEKMNDGTRKVDENGDVILVDGEDSGFYADVEKLLEQEHVIVLKSLQVNMLQSRNPANEVMLHPQAIAALEDAGLLTYTPDIEE